MIPNSVHLFVHVSIYVHRFIVFVTKRETLQIWKAQNTNLTLFYFLNGGGGSSTPVPPLYLPFVSTPLLSYKKWTLKVLQT